MVGVPGGWIQICVSRASSSPHRRDRSGRYAHTYPPFVLTFSVMKVVARFIVSMIRARSGACARGAGAVASTANATTPAVHTNLRARLDIGHRTEQAAFPAARIEHHGGCAIEHQRRAPGQIVDRPRG